MEKSLNDIFIGTFDSLCQKWLGEFALETGTSNNEKLLDEEIEPIQKIVRNHLRTYYFLKEQEEDFLKQTISSGLNSNTYSLNIQKNLSFF